MLMLYFLVRLQGELGIDHCWESRGLLKQQIYLVDITPIVFKCKNVQIYLPFIWFHWRELSNGLSSVDSHKKIPSLMFPSTNLRSDAVLVSLKHVFHFVFDPILCDVSRVEAHGGDGGDRVGLGESDLQEVAVVLAWLLSSTPSKHVFHPGLCWKVFSQHGRPRLDALVGDGRILHAEGAWVARSSCRERGLGRLSSDCWGLLSS